jgi:hypothetical protein
MGTEMKKQSPQRSPAGKDSNKKDAGLYGSQAPKRGARPSSGDTVVQSKPAGSKLHGDKLSEPGYLDDAAERELHKGAKGKSASSRGKSGMAPR